MSDGSVVGAVVVLLVVLATAVSLLLAAYSWVRIDHPVSESYGLLMLADSTWAGFYLVMILGGGGLVTDIGLVGKATASALAGVAWLLFVSEYTGDSEWIPRWFWIVMSIEAVVFGALVAVNPGGLVIADVVVGQLGAFTFAVESAGIVTQLQLLVGAGLVVTSLVMLGRFFLQTQTVYRFQALIIFGVGAVVVVSSALFVNGIRLHPLVDPTPLLFNLQALAVGWALYRYDFLKLAPVVVTRFFRDMNDPVLLINAEFVVADYNRAVEQLVGGLDERLPLAEIEDDAFGTTIKTALTSRDDDIEYSTVRTDGGQRTYDIEVTRVTDQFDTIQGHIVVLRDITERKRRERRLRKQNQRLEEFADVVSHDLRNPLSTASGWTELVDRRLAAAEPEIDEAREGIAKIEQSHERMDELIDMLLTLARQGQTVDDPEPVGIDDCATAAWETADTGEMELSVEADRTIEADRTRLRQAFENLFRNAREHGSASTVRVEDTPAGFAVEDDGEGLLNDDDESLFEFGYSTDDDGTGIGLSVVKRIADAHGWQITADESTDGGARFEITQL